MEIKINSDSWLSLSCANLLDQKNKVLEWQFSQLQSIYDSPIMGMRMLTRVADPNVFGPPGSGSVSQRNESGTGAFYHQAKIVRKTLVPTVLWFLYDFISLKNDVNVPSKSKVISRTTFKKSFLLASWRSMTKIAESWSISHTFCYRINIVPYKFCYVQVMFV